MTLSERDRGVLDFERSWWKLPGSKESAIREQLGLSSTAYYRILNRLIDDPAALEYDPLGVRRIRRQRDLRRRARFEGRQVGPRQR